MTITNRAMNERLSNYERCAEMAPDGTYLQTKKAVEAMHDTSSAILEAFRAAGFKAGNDDRLRNLEVAIYAYFLQSNPDDAHVYASEGFGEHVDGPAGRRVLDQAVRDRDFLASFA